MTGIRWRASLMACTCTAAFATTPTPPASAMAARPSATSSAPAVASTRAPAAGQAGAPSATEVAAWAAGCRIEGQPDPFHAVLDGDAAPIATRRSVLAELRQCAVNGSVSVQDFVGALYWMGDELPAALVAHDAANAELYFSNAAGHGNILDMAKLAEIELAAGHFDAAMTWAQIYAHYQPRPANVLRARRQSYLPELLARIDQGFDTHHDADVMAHVAAFIAIHGPDIAAYRAHLRERNARHPRRLRITPVHLRYAGTRIGRDGRLDRAGFASFLVEILPDGRPDQAWLIDAYPTVAVGRRLRAVAMSDRFPTSARPGDRFREVHVVFNDRRYRLRGTN